MFVVGFDSRRVAVGQIDPAAFVRREFAAAGAAEVRSVLAAPASLQVPRRGRPDD